MECGHRLVRLRVYRNFVLVKIRGENLQNTFITYHKNKTA